METQYWSKCPRWIFEFWVKLKRLCFEENSKKISQQIIFCLDNVTITSSLNSTSLTFQTVKVVPTNYFGSHKLPFKRINSANEKQYWADTIIHTSYDNLIAFAHTIHLSHLSIPTVSVNRLSLSHRAGVNKTTMQRPFPVKTKHAFSVRTHRTWWVTTN